MKRSIVTASVMLIAALSFGALTLTALLLGVSSTAHAASPAELPSIAEAPWRFSAVG